MAFPPTLRSVLCFIIFPLSSSVRVSYPTAPSRTLLLPFQQQKTYARCEKQNMLWLDTELRHMLCLLSSILRIIHNRVSPCRAYHRIEIFSGRPGDVYFGHPLRKISASSQQYLVELVSILYTFLFLSFLTLVLPSSWTSRGHRCRPFFPPVLAFNFYRA